MEQLLVPLLSAAIGWALRHFDVIAPTNAPPQTRPGGAGTVLAPQAQADLPSLIGSIVSEEVKKGVAYLESRLPPLTQPAIKPQT